MKNLFSILSTSFALFSLVASVNSYAFTIKSVPLTNYNYNKPIQPFTDSFYTIFAAVDKNELKKALDENNISKSETLMKPVATTMARYLFSKTGENFTADVEESSIEVIMMGVFYHMRENNYDVSRTAAGNNRQNSPTVAGGGPWECFIGALGGIIGLQEIGNLYHDYTHGVTPRTVFRTMRTMLRRVAGVFTIAMAVYELVSCLL